MYFAFNARLLGTSDKSTNNCIFAIGVEEVNLSDGQCHLFLGIGGFEFAYDAANNAKFQGTDDFFSFNDELSKGAE